VVKEVIFLVLLSKKNDFVRAPSKADNSVHPIKRHIVSLVCVFLH
jgi:hypothetical protein